jgi:hypothetical protein
MLPKPPLSFYLRDYPLIKLGFSPSVALLTKGSLQRKR